MDTGLKPRTIPLLINKDERMKKSFKPFLLLATLIPFLISNSYAFPNNKETPFNGKDLPLEKYKQYEFPNASQVFLKIKMILIQLISTGFTLLKTHTKSQKT